MQLSQTCLLASALLLAGSLAVSAQDAKPAGEIKCTLTVSVELAGGEFELRPVKHDDPDVFNLARSIATVTVNLKQVS